MNGSENHPEFKVICGRVFWERAIFHKRNFPGTGLKIILICTISVFSWPTNNKKQSGKNHPMFLSREIFHV